MTTDLTDIEQQLVDAVETGDVLDLRPDPSTADVPMDEWGEERTIRASVIRDLLLQRHARSQDLHGLQLRGARIPEHLDLRNVHSPIALALLTCAIPRGITLSNADLPSIHLAGSTIGTTDTPRHVLFAAGLTVQGDLRLGVDPYTNTRTIVHDVINMRGGRVTGQFSMIGAQLDGHDAAGNSLIGDMPQVDGDALFSIDGGTAQPFTTASALRLLRGRITGQLHMAGAQLNGRDAAGNSLFGDMLHVDGGAYFHVDPATRQPFTAAGTVRLLRGRITGQLHMAGAQLNGRDAAGTSLGGDGLQVNGNAVFSVDNQTDLPFTTAAGAVRLLGGRIAGQLDMAGAQLNGQDADGASLVIDGLQVDGGAFLDVDPRSLQPFTAAGTVGLHGAHITGQLDMAGAELNGKDANDNSLIGDALRVDGDASFSVDRGSGMPFTAAGTVRLHSAHITGQLRMAGAQLNGHKAGVDSLIGEGMQIDSSVILTVDERTAQPFTAAGAVRLSDSHIRGTLHGPNSVVRHETSPPTWLLRGATVERLSLHPRSMQRIDLTGCTYGAIPAQGNVDQWLDLIRNHTNRYHPQP